MVNNVHKHVRIWFYILKSRLCYSKVNKNNLPRMTFGEEPPVHTILLASLLTLDTWIPEYLSNMFVWGLPFTGNIASFLTLCNVSSSLCCHLSTNLLKQFVSWLAYFLASALVISVICINRPALPFLILTWRENKKK